MPDLSTCPGCGNVLVDPNAKICPVCNRIFVPDTGAPYQQRREVDQARSRANTLNGLILATFAIIMLWIPYIQYVGYIAMFIGSVFIIIGRGAFGSRHALMVRSAVFLFIISLGAEVVLVVGIIGNVVNISSNISALQSYLNSVMIAAIVVGTLMAISQTLLVLGLSDRTGMTVLFLAVAATVAVSMFVYLYLTPMLLQAANQAYATNSTLPLLSLESKINTYRLLDGIPNAFMAAGYYMAFLRVRNGRFPEGKMQFDTGSVML